MRKLTRDELVAEMMVRLQLRKLGGRLSGDIVRLVAEMIELSSEQVPNCYEQSGEITSTH